MLHFPFTTPALQITQPIGTFYVAALTAELLLQVAASDVMSAALNPDGIGYTLSGTQRLIQDKRLGAIADYVERVDSAFPNSIILAANYDSDVGFDLDEVEAIEEERLEDAGSPPATAPRSRSWTVSEDGEGRVSLHIPSAAKLAAIIDGQHRLFGFAKTDPRGPSLRMPLVCAVFLDLPKPLQAQLFATINSTQKPVDRSLTFELFGYNVSDEPEEFWSPDKLAVFFTRKLGTDEGSALKGRVSVAPKQDEALKSLTGRPGWHISTAVVVDGLLRLFSTNPKRDANTMRTSTARPRSALRSGAKDRSPLRELFIEGNDALIYTLAANYLTACGRVFWEPARPDSYIRKTVGVQALFDVMRKLAPEALEARDVRVSYFQDKLLPAAAVDFSEDQFRVPSGSGRSFIRKTIEYAIGIV